MAALQVLSGYVASVLAATSLFAGITPETISKLRLDVAVPWKMPPPIAPSLLHDGTASVKYCGCSSIVALHVFFRLVRIRACFHDLKLPGFTLRC